MSDPSSPRALTIKNAALRLQVSDRQIRRWITDGSLGCVLDPVIRTKAGTPRRLVTVESIESLESQRVPA